MNVLIIEDHPLISKGLKLAILEIEENVKVFQAITFPIGLLCLQENDIDILILDIDIPGGESVKMIEHIREITPDVVILIHSGYDEKVYALPYLRAGANGFLSKKATHEDFISAWTTITENRKYVSPAIQELLIENGGDPSEKNAGNPVLSLSPRELRVMHLIVEGKWNKEIAAAMDLKENTISTYKKRIYEKFNVKDERELLKQIAIYL